MIFIGLAGSTMARRDNMGLAIVEAGMRMAGGPRRLVRHFLSCLGGSALEITTNNVLIVKELWMKKATFPFFEQCR